MPVSWLGLHLRAWQDHMRLYHYWSEFNAKENKCKKNKLYITFQLHEHYMSSHYNIMCSSSSGSCASTNLKQRSRAMISTNQLAVSSNLHIHITFTLNCICTRSVGSTVTNEPKYPALCDHLMKHTFWLVQSGSTGGVTGVTQLYVDLSL